MNGGLRYRLAGLFGTVALAAGAVVVANQPPVRAGVEFLPLLGDLPIDTARGAELTYEAGTTAILISLAVLPLFKPRPRRILDVWMAALRRTSIGLLGLATVGYFDYTYRLPRATLVVTGAFLLVVLPAYFVAIRRRPRTDGDRTLIIGDNPQSMVDILEAIEGNVIGYVAPPTLRDSEASRDGIRVGVTDGGSAATLGDLPYLGGLSRLDEVIVDQNVDTAILAFSQPDRGDFFGTLDSCYEHGVNAKVHRDHADAVLTRGVAAGELVDIDLEPWDFQDHLLKRAFDLIFSVAGLFVLSPVILAIALAVKLEDGGPVLYSQERTATFGDTFTVYKFRSMVPDAESDGASLSDEDAGGVDPRVTRTGRLLRQTHLDEIPQLWAILWGHMSVVGPRPERPALDHDMEIDAEAWRSRWFVKPGLTGLAQINDITGHNPEEKLRLDIRYIGEQSFWFDLKIVIRQLWKMFGDLYRAGRGDAETR